MRKTLRHYAVVLLATTMLSFPAAAAPAPDVGIAAVVGSDAISSYEVDNRMRFIIITAHLSDTPDVVEKIRPQVIRTMIDERLKLQEAKKNDIKISDADVEQAIEAIGQQRGMPKDEIYRIMDSNHIPRETLLQQMRAQLAWNQLLARKVRPQVRVSEEEITMASRHYTPPPKQNTAQGGVVQELKISVIALPVDKPSRLHEINKLADKLVKELRGGASFDEVSRQFSSVTASSGGKVEAFWVKPNQLEPHLAALLVNATPGMVTNPLRSSEGFTIIKVFDVHSAPAKSMLASEAAAAEEDKPKGAEVMIKEILIKPKAADQVDAMRQAAEAVVKTPGICEDKAVAGADGLKDVTVEATLIKKQQADLPPAIKTIAETLKPGEISTPFASSEGVRLYMLCSRKDTEEKATRDEVFHMLLQEKMGLEAEKYIRNLRRDVFIDVRS